MKGSARPIVAILLVAAAAVAFWTLALNPQREEADQLGSQVEALSASVDQARSELAQATVARRSFPVAYHQLVELGQAVPAGDETPSLLVELQDLARRSGVTFESIKLEGEGEAASPAPTEAAPPTTEGESSATGTPAAEIVPATEVAAALLPLGASIGAAGLGVMPYSLTFQGSFFGIARFIGKVDDLVRSNKATMAVDGRLVTIDGFSLLGGGSEGGETAGSTELQATFSVTTYLTPPGQGITAGATPSAPAPESATQTVAAR